MARGCVGSDAKKFSPSGLLDIGHRLMRKCGGLPLALVVLGGLLSMKEKTPVVWLRMLETMDWEAEGRECQEILALSYENLPYHMKSCFLYLGAYPEDYEISGSVLIKRWVAEGFIPQEERKTMEDTGEAILEELIQRSLIHVITRKSNGSVKRCGTHDLLLDFARCEAKKDGFLAVCSSENDQAATYRTIFPRRVAMHSANDMMINEIKTMHGLRTLMLFGRHDGLIVSGMLRFELLRVFDLARISSLERILKDIKLMIHLRYLALSCVNYSRVPSSIGNLQCLETINIEGRVNVPITLWKIKTLRHIELCWCKLPQSHESRNLLTLGFVKLESHRTINWRFPNLRKLKVMITEEHHGAMLAHLLSQLDQLISLFIIAVRPATIETDTKDFPFHNHLTSLRLDGSWPMWNTISEFPTYLTKLVLKCSKLEQDPMPKLERLQYLATLKLEHDAYVGKIMVCSAGGFPRLERLFMTCEYVEEWRVERGAMPKLTFLDLGKWKKLKTLPDVQHVMTLQELKLTVISEELMLRLESETGEDWHKIQHVPKLTISKW